MMSYLHTKFHDNWISSFRGVAMTRFWDGQTDRRPDGQTDGVTALLDLLSPSATQVKIYIYLHSFFSDSLQLMIHEMVPSNGVKSGRNGSLGCWKLLFILFLFISGRENCSCIVIAYRFIP